MSVSHASSPSESTVPRSRARLGRLPTIRGPVLTLRGAALALFVTFLLLGPVSDASDIVAAVIAFSFLGLFSLVLSLSIFGAWRSYKRVRAELDATGPLDEKFEPESQREVPFVLPLHGANLLPFWSLSLTLEFEQPGVESVTHIVTGKSNPAARGGTRYLRDSLWFPHRGYWKCLSIRAEFGDQAGLTRLNWRLSGPGAHQSFRVMPPRLHHSSLPVITSSSRSGDLVTDLLERRGDPFDLKPYHPSDGMRKILWKVYAKTGELISRHPERSMTPEGVVLIYAAADKQDDHVCSSLLAYLEKLEDLDLRFVAGLEGMFDKAPAFTPEEALHLSQESVWDTASSNSASRWNEIHSVLDAARAGQPDLNIDKIVVFSSAERIKRDGEGWLLDLATRLAQSGFEPVLCVISKAQPSVRTGRQGRSSGSRIPARLRKWLIADDHDRKSNQRSDDSAYQRFHGVCRKQNWQVILEELP